MGLGRISPSSVAGPGSNGGTAPIVAVLAIAVFMSSLDLFIVNLAFPSIAQDYPGVGLDSLSWVLNAYTIVFAAVLIPAGRWADQVGRRRALVTGLALFTGGSLLCGLAPGVAWLVAARGGQGVGAGGVGPAALSLLLAVVPAEQRARALGSWSALGALGAALGPVIGGGLVGLGWRWVFWVNLPVGIVAIVLALRSVPGEPGRRTARSPRHPRCAAPRARRRAGRGGAGQGAGLGLGVGRVPGDPRGGGPVRGGARPPLGASSRAGAGAGPVPVADVLRCRGGVGPLLRGLRRLRPQHGRVPHRSLALLAGAGGAGHSSGSADGAAVRPVGRAPVDPVAGRGRAGRGSRLRGQRRRAGRVAGPHPGRAGLPHAPAAGSAAGGAGVGLTIPSLLGVGSAGLPAAHFGTG